MRTAIMALVASVSFTARAAIYECPATKKLEANHTWTAEQLKRGKFSTKVEELPEGTFVSRCSFSRSEKKVTCDRYRVDRVEVDPYIGVKKFYVFSSQLDFQVFADLFSIENNGRGSIQFGRCSLVAP